MHRNSPHFSHLFFKLAQQFIFKHISTLCSMTFHIYKNTICIGKWLLIESAVSWMQVYLAAWIFPTSFGSMPLLFHAHFLIGQIGLRGNFIPPWRYAWIFGGCREIASSPCEAGRVVGMVHWNSELLCRAPCCASLTAHPLSASSLHPWAQCGLKTSPRNSAIISEPSLDAHNPQAVTFITELQTSTACCLMAELTWANWAEIARF